MSIRRKLAGGAAILALTVGGLAVASPAQAVTRDWGPLWTSKSECLYQTKQKLRQIKSLNPDYVNVKYVCKSGSGGYWQTHITYRY